MFTHDYYLIYKAQETEKVRIQHDLSNHTSSTYAIIKQSTGIVGGDPLSIDIATDLSTAQQPSASGITHHPSRANQRSTDNSKKCSSEALEQGLVGSGQLELWVGGEPELRTPDVIPARVSI